MVGEAANVLEAHLMHAADTLAHERSSLEQELASHKSLVASIRAAQARLMQVQKERDEAVAASAKQCEAKTRMSQRVAHLESVIRSSTN